MPASSLTTSFTPTPSLLADLLANLPQGVIASEAVRDTSGIIVNYRAYYANAQALAIIGYSVEQLTSQLLYEWAPHALTHAEQIRRVVEEQIPFDFEYFHPVSHHWYCIENRPLNNGLCTTFRNIDEAKQAQQQTENQTRLLQGVMDAMDEAIAYCEAVRDPDGRVIDFTYQLTNAASDTIVGFSADQVIGKRITTFFPELREMGVLQQFIDVVDSGQPQRIEQSYQVDDNEGWYLMSIIPLLNGVVIYYKDISASKQAARQIEEQALIFDDVLKSITNGLCVLEAVRNENGAVIDFRYVRVSQAICRDTELSVAQLEGKSILSLFPGLQETTYWTAYLAALTTGQTQHFELHYQRDRFDNYTDNWVTRIDENRIISIYSIVNDQKRVELEARQQAAMLQSVLDSCQMPIVLFEAIRSNNGQIADFRYLLQNEANARAVGHPLDQTTTRTMLDVLPSLKSIGVFDRYVDVVTTGQPQRFEQQIADGAVDGWFDMSIVKQGDGIVIAANDQTLLRQTLLRAEKLVGDLKQSNQQLEQFAYIASHDLQEPLRKIRSFGDILVRNYSALLPDEGQDMIARMQSSAERMGVFIRDLLAYSRLATQDDPFQPVALETLLADIQQDLSVVITETHAQVIVGSSSQPLPTVNGSLLQLRQLFQNLISNALKFSRSGVQPQVTVQSRTVGPESVPDTVLNRASQSWVAIDVTDNGIGFEEKYEERIFQLFERLHSRSAYSGTGIGLAICRKVAENHGGAILAHSQPGQGAQFTVFLPISAVSITE
ncbi:PAS domain-containing sensor histidine kinase [Spirosoma spitsbergense]|uniref:PAS domain-containing sensor histidine kinase n=1 Tax=Spirosoma spitsbergense TaxID=431554 RepID=UPI0003603554|nr:PAS domain-containing sensor histidine kinase [Spirosoma spitsbergense]